MLGSLKRRNASGGPKGRIFSFPDGLGELTSTIAYALDQAVRLQTEVKAIRPLPRTTGRSTAKAAGGHGPKGCAAKQVALPADALASLD